MKDIKYLLRSTILLLVLSLGVVSCDLNKTPFSSIGEPSADWTDIRTADRFRTGLYSSFRSNAGGVSYYATDYQSDLFNALIGFGNNGGDLTRWTFTFNQGSVTSVWSTNYSIIKNVNYILARLPEVVANSDSDRAFLKNFEGECHLIRAICYHNLALRFAKDYEPTTAANELGLPIVKTIDFDKKPDRSTLQETYDFIKAEIALARTNLIAQGKPDAIFLTKDIVDAFEARVDLYMHNYTSAVSLVENVIDNYPLTNSAEEYAKMWKEDTSTEILFKAFASVDERYNSMSMYTSAGLYRVSGQVMVLYPAYYIPTRGAMELYENDDVRFESFFKAVPVLSAGYIDNLYILHKFPGNESLKKDPDEFSYYHMHKPFRVAELYLIAAEASHLSGNDAQAVEWLNKLRVARGASSLDLTADALFKAIQEEWIREFIGEGMRIDQLKRWNLGFKRMDPQHSIDEPGEISGLVMSGEDFDELEIPAGHEKFVWEIPQNDLIANPNLKPNWGN